MLDLISNFRKNIFNGFKDEEIEKIEDFWTILEKCDIETGGRESVLILKRPVHPYYIKVIKTYFLTYS